MPKIHQLCLISLLLTSWIASTANIRLQVEWLSGNEALRKNVHAQLSTIRSNELAPDRSLRARVDDAIRKGLKALGYYEPTIDFNLRPLPTSGRGQQVLLARISPGKPVIIGGTNVTLRGEARKDHDYLDLLATIPKVGTVVNHCAYDRFKKNLTNIALYKGYFDSYFTKSQLKVIPQRRLAFWNIDYNSGARYIFGDVTFEGSQIREEYLQNLIPFRKGDYYKYNDLNELHRRLSAISWFKSVVVTPEFNKAREDKVLPLHVVVSPSTKNTIETGVGYSTDVGPHMKVMWKKPWMNSYSHSLLTRASISMMDQQLSLSYKIPLLKNPLERYYLIQGGFRRINRNYTKQDSTMLAVSRYLELSNAWKQMINLRWSLDHFAQANITNTTMLVYPHLMISRTRSRGDLVMPVWGDSQCYSIDYSNSSLGSDVDFSVVQVQNVWIRTIYNKHRFFMRGNLGWIETSNFKRVPPDLRFFAGGDRSIRGYKYKSIAPKNEKGQLTGASKMVTGLLEYQYNITGKWWSAIFIDGGEAVNNIHKSNFKTSMGVGARLHSLVGMIKLDLAVPLSDKDTHSLQFYIGLGPEL